MEVLAKNFFVNLPVKDLNKTKEFFSKLGFKFNPEFTNELAACMIISNNVFAMLLTEDHFKNFTKKSIADTDNSTEAIMALQVDSKEKVNEMVNNALAFGGKPSKEPMDHGFMYGWSFQDLDGHLWELFFMDGNSQ